MVRRVMAVVAVALVTVASIMSPASAAPDGEESIMPGLMPEVAALMEAQLPLDQLAERIQAAARDTPRSGLGGLRADPAHSALEVYWHGPMQARVLDQIEAAREDDLTVTVTPARYTRTQLLREADRLAMLNMGPSDAAVQMATIGPKVDGSGLEVGVSGLDSPLQPATMAAQARRELPDLASSIPLDIIPADLAQATDRAFDTPPFSGGVLMFGPASTCTTGFGVTGLNGTGQYILTAHHCGEGQWETVDRVIGTTIPAGVVRDHDTMLILTSEGAHFTIYVGGHFNRPGTEHFLVRIAGAQGSIHGDLVCTSGAFSGTVCGALVTGTLLTINIVGYGVVTGMVRADHSTTAVHGNGDSGGPVVAAVGPDVFARGTISAKPLNDNHPCQGIPAGNGRTCSRTLYYPNILLQLERAGVRINTG